MAQEDEGTGFQGAPPSFIPAGSRRRAMPSPHADGGLQPKPAQGASHMDPSASASAAVPPSFTPAPARTAGRGAHLRQDQAAQPVSFTPPSGRRAVRSVQATHSESAQRPSPAQARTRRSSGSRNVSGPRRAMPSSRPASARTPDVSRPRAEAAAATRSFTRRHRPGAPRIIAGIAIALVAALVLSLLGGWHWVGSRLNKEDGWLTSAANTPADTWLILGSDERDGTAGGSADDTPGFRTDTILVLTKPKNGPSSLISIPRDSLTQVDGQYMKINAVAQLYGNQALVGTVEQITGQKIDHIAKIKFGGLTKVVDAIGGVQLCYDQTVSDVYSGLDWQAGCHNVDGTTALAFSRMRYADANGDFGRAQRQRQVISAIVSKATSKNVLGNPGKVLKLADAGLAALTVDSRTSPMTLLDMALAFKDATGAKGVTGSVYWSDPDYQVDGVGSSVLLDDSKNTQLFSELAGGTHEAGTVGTLAEAG